MWDLGGQTSIRPYWRCYYANTQAIIYVVDSSDRDRLSVNKAELLAMLSEEELQDAKLLVFANKQVSFVSSGLPLRWGINRHIGPTIGTDTSGSFRGVGTGYTQRKAMEYT